MMMIRNSANPLGFIFCHGWGFHPLYWEKLKPYFLRYPCFFWNLGYFEKESKPLPCKQQKVDWIGIGHSLGFQKLLQSQFPFKGFIALQGFLHFLGYEQTMQALRHRILLKMLKDFSKDPTSTLHSFYKLCGWKNHSFLKNLNKIHLEKDLKALFQDFSPVLSTSKILILGSMNDPIVPKSLLQDNFQKLPQSKIQLHPNGKHLLGHLKIHWCIQQIREFLKTL